MANVTVLKETLYEYIILVTGNTQETNTKIINASTIANAKTGLTFYHLPLREIVWSVGPSAVLTLIWEGSPNLPFLYLSYSGNMELSDKVGTKIKNTATNATGDVLISTSAAVPYTFIAIFEKSVESYDKTDKFHY